MPSNLSFIIDQVGKDKGIDRKVIIEALEQAVLTASRKKYGHQGEIEVHYNEEAGEVELFQFKQVVEEVMVGEGRSQRGEGQPGEIPDDAVPDHQHDELHVIE